MADNPHPRVFHRRATREFGLAVGFLSLIDGMPWLASTREEAEAGLPDTMVQLDPNHMSEEQNSATGETCFIYRGSMADAIRFPAGLSSRIAAEIEVIAWNDSDLLCDIPENNPDASYLASRYADDAAGTWEDANDCPEGYLPYRIVDTARRALVARVQAEIDRRQLLVETEYFRRRRQRLIDACGVGNVPTFYGMVDEQLARMPPRIATTSGQESVPFAPIASEVLIMSQFAKKGVVALWHFQCPECGFGDAEFCCPATSADSIHCEICLDDGQTIRLKRWPVDEFVPDLRAA